MILNRTFKRLLMFDSHIKVHNTPVLLQKDKEFMELNSLYTSILIDLCSWKDVVIIISLLEEELNSRTVLTVSSGVLDSVSDNIGSSANYPACFCLPVYKHCSSQGLTGDLFMVSH